MKSLAYLLVMGFVVLTSGCATIMSDNKTPVQIDTNPSQAECTISGAGYKEEITTPANLVIPAQAAPITIDCTKTGYFPVSEIIDTSINGATFGNIIFGGGIGFLLDYATKSGHKYPDSIQLTLQKSEFTSIEAKETYFKSERDKFNQIAEDERNEIMHKDFEDEYEREQAIGAVDVALNLALTKLESQEKIAVVKE